MSMNNVDGLKNLPQIPKAWDSNLLRSWAIECHAKLSHWPRKWRFTRILEPCWNRSRPFSGFEVRGISALQASKPPPAARLPWPIPIVKWVASLKATNPVEPSPTILCARAPRGTTWQVRGDCRRAFPRVPWISLPFRASRAHDICMQASRKSSLCTLQSSSADIYVRYAVSLWRWMRVTAGNSHDNFSLANSCNCQPEGPVKNLWVIFIRRDYL